MKVHVQLSAFVFIRFLIAWVDCASVPSCASMRSWFPGTPPASFADNLPYQLSVTGYVPDGESTPVYNEGSFHTVYLNGSVTVDHIMRNFVGFIVYAENSVKSYTNGRFVKEDLPVGVEEANCGNGFIIQNSTSVGNWTSLKLFWKPPKDGYYAGNITFRASVVEKTNPLTYYEGFTALLRYECPKMHCTGCPGNQYLYDNYGCQTCQCSGSCEFACAEIYAPVCGSDDKTYDNKCSMELEACVQKKEIFVLHEGKCSSCSFHCVSVHNPVCGTDGKTYNNPCSLKSDACVQKRNVSNTGTQDRNVSVAHVGPCGGCPTFCAAVNDPVCGTDGKTYSNECILRSVACVQKKNTAVSHKGECSGAERLGFPGLSLMFTFLAFLWFSV